MNTEGPSRTALKEPEPTTTQHPERSTVTPTDRGRRPVRPLVVLLVAVAALAAVWLIERAGPGEDAGPTTADVISDYDAQIDRLVRERAAAGQSAGATAYDGTIDRLLREREADSAATYDATIDRLLRERDDARVGDP